jgi:hypothetical protein
MQKHARALIAISDLLHVTPRYRKLRMVRKVSPGFGDIATGMWQISGTPRAPPFLWLLSLGQTARRH